MVRRRRFLHDVFVQEGIMPRDHQFIYHNESILRKVNFLHETNDNLIYKVVLGKSVIPEHSMDCDYLAECCREVFPEELKALEVLFGY